MGAALCWCCLRWPHPAHAKGAEPLVALPVCPVCPVSALGGGGSTSLLAPWGAEPRAGGRAGDMRHVPRPCHMAHVPSPCPLPMSCVPRPLPCVPFPLPRVPCPLPFVPCLLPHIPCPLPYVPYHVSPVPCHASHVPSPMLLVPSPMSQRVPRHSATPHAGRRGTGPPHGTRVLPWAHPTPRPQLSGFVSPGGVTK